jgi:hypothetical protein
MTNSTINSTEPRSDWHSSKHANFFVTCEPPQRQKLKRAKRTYDDGSPMAKPSWRQGAKRGSQSKWLDS